MHRISDIKKLQVTTCEVRVKNGWETIFEPVLGHIKFLGQIKAPLMLVWGLEHPGRPKGTLYPEWSLIMTWCLILVARPKISAAYFNQANITVDKNKLLD